MGGLIFGFFRLYRELEALDSPVEVREDRVVGEFERGGVFGGDARGALEVEGFSSEGVREELLDVVVGNGDELED